MKKFSILALLCATLAITPAFAEMNLDYNTPSVELSTQSALLSTAYEPTTLPTVPVDLSFAFNDIENLQAKDMTLVEMQETEGAALPYIAGAAAIGGFYNLGSYAHNVPNNQRTWRGYATAFGSGAIGGAVAATPIGAIRAPIIGGGIVLAGDSTANNKMRK